MAKFVNELIYKYCKYDGCEFKFSSYTENGKYILKFERVPNMPFINDGISHVRLYFRGSTNVTIDHVNVYAYGMKYAAINENVTTRQKFPITANVNNSYIDVPIDAPGKSFEIVLNNIGGNIEIIAALNGTYNNINDEAFDKYRQENP